MTPSTERALRLLERLDVPDAHRKRLADIVAMVEALGEEHGEEVQAEFGKEHMALIAAHNQFLRIYRAGAHAGRIELLAPTGWQAVQAAGFTLHDAVGGQVFRLFGWKVLDPMDGPEEALRAAVRAAWDHARRRPGPG